MSVSRSEDYYFQGGDLVLEVNTTLFKLHRDMLRRHSGFFEDMFSLPVAGTEGQDDEQPLSLSQDLCSLDAFKTICSFLYPKTIGTFPRAFVNDLNKWEPVLMACEALQFHSIQAYILSQLQTNGGTISIASEPVRLLYWAMRSETTAQMLALNCIQALAYRRRPLSEAEIIKLGSKTTTQVIHIREKLRTMFVSQQALANHLKLRRCMIPDLCPNTIARWFTRDLLKVNSTDDSDNSDIFQLSSAAPQNLCPVCGASAIHVIRRLRWQGLDSRIQQWARDVGVLTTPSQPAAPRAS